MLTATQIEVAQANLRAWEDSGLLPAEITALDALAAYKRVVALLDDWHNRAPAMEGTDELRRALEG
jgi:hypothetical protein